MKTTLITREHWKVMPWKNGAGVTTEIAIAPAGSSLEAGNFDWRLSSARIERANRFSAFPSYDRWLTVLSGAGLELNGRKLLTFETFHFRGEDVVECRPLDGAVDDLGIIFKRDRFECSMHVVDVTMPTALPLAAPLSFLRPLSGACRIAGVHVGSSDFLQVDMGTSVDVSSPARLLIIAIARR